MEKSLKYRVLDSIDLASDLHIKAIKTTQSDFWYVQFNLPGVGQKRQSLKTRSKHEADTRGKRFVREFEAGNVTAAKQSRVTIREAGESHVAKKNIKRRKAHTLGSARRTYAKLEGWCRDKGIHYVDELNVRVMDKFERALSETGVSLPESYLKENKRRRTHAAKPLDAETLRGTMNAVRGLIKFAVEQELIGKDPCPGYELPRAPVREVEVYSAAELNLLFQDEAMFADVWRFLMNACLRRDEFVWLLKKDVIFDPKGVPVAIHIRKKRCPITGECWNPKHGLERVVGLTKAAAAIVAMWLAQYDGPWLFPDANGTKSGGRWAGDKLLRRLHYRLDEAGIGHGILHTFRHTGASLFANDPVSPMPLPLLQKHLGHKSIKSTQRYLHVNVDDLVAAVQRVDLGGTSGLTSEMRAVTRELIAASGTAATEGGELSRRAS